MLDGPERAMAKSFEYIQTKPADVTTAGLLVEKHRKSSSITL